MKSSRAYRSRSVKQLRPEEVTKGRGGSGVHVGLDVGKEQIYATLRWGTRDFSRPWKAANPSELGTLVEALCAVGRGRSMVVAMEPTGTYGDALRQSKSDSGLVVHRVSPKASHDYAEIFDGVPSQHDGKDAAIVAELSSLGKSSVWAFGQTEWEDELSYWVDWMDAQRRTLVIWYGRLEGLLSRHWPEATRLLPLSSGVLLRSIAHYGSPAALSSDAAASDRLRRWGRGHLSEAKCAELLRSAGESVGVRASEPTRRRLRVYAEQSLSCRLEVSRSRQGLQKLCGKHEVIASQGEVVGFVTACVLWSHLGDPRQYDSGAAYRKAMGLNLKERSSGKWHGRVKISKRGSSQVRRWLYFSALRWVKRPEVKGWYEAKKARREGDRTEAMRGLVGVMRKLALALYQVGAGKRFDAGLLFPGSSVLSAGQRV